MRRIVLSASRRTDIPAFYMPWFMERIAQGLFEVPHPYGGPPTVVPATADRVHTIVFWSKNFGPFLEGDFGKALVDQGYHLFFNFTINSSHPLLEPGVPALEARLEQLARLCEQFGPDHIQWRFDPICCYREADGRSADNGIAFETIARRAAALGIRTCITSFVDLYRKVQRRFTATTITLTDPPLSDRRARILAMARLLDPLQIRLCLCCEQEVLAALPDDTTVRQAACIPNHHLARLNGKDISLARDTGQRVAAGCGCQRSRDVGSYAQHPCHHNCLFCYANPAGDRAVQKESRL